MRRRFGRASVVCWTNETHLKTAEELEDFARLWLNPKRKQHKEKNSEPNTIAWSLGIRERNFNQKEYEIQYNIFLGFLEKD